MNSLNKFQPKTLDEAVEFVVKAISTQPDSKEFIEKCKDDESKFLGSLHHGYGTALRNEWGLWKGSDLSKWFNEKEIYHADDMSGIILTTVFRKYFNLPINLEDQIKKYHKHWLKTVGRINPNEK